MNAEAQLLSFRRYLILLFIVALGISLVSGYSAIQSQWTGIATYHNHARKGKGSTEVVTREGAPVKFKAAVDELWMFFTYGAVGAAVAFLIFRKIDE